MKKVVAVVKLQLPAGKATPAPPVGPALGQHGANIMEFVKQYNAVGFASHFFRELSAFFIADIAGRRADQT